MVKWISDRLPILTDLCPSFSKPDFWCPLSYKLYMIHNAECMTQNKEVRCICLSCRNKCSEFWLQPAHLCHPLQQPHPHQSPSDARDGQVCSGHLHQLGELVNESVSQSVSQMVKSEWEIELDLSQAVNWLKCDLEFELGGSQTNLATS